jgi:hypothetical protein
MKKVYLLALITLGSCTSNNRDFAYETILKGLGKSYTINKIVEKRNFLLCMNIDDSLFKKDSLQYEKSRKDFYNSEVDIVYYLLKYQNDSLKYCSWIKVEDPCRSTIYLSEFISKSKGALILIDNYLKIKDSTIEIRAYCSKIKFDKVGQILIKNKGQDVDFIKLKYKEYIESLNNPME